MIRPLTLFKIVRILLAAGVLGLTTFASAFQCGCIFVEPLPPRNIRVQRGKLTLPSPPPRLIFSDDVLLINGEPVGKMVCQQRGADGNIVNAVITVPASPKRQRVPCDASSSSKGVPDSSLEEFERKRRELDPGLMSFQDNAILILIPRRGLVLSASPEFYLYLPPNSGGYEIRLSGEKGVLFDESIQKKNSTPFTVFKYPTSALPLKPGSTYQFQVRDLDNEFDKPDAAVFKLAERETIVDLTKSLRSIDELSVDDLSKRILRASFFGSHAIYLDAVRELETVSSVQDGPSVAVQNDPEALRLLGDLYRLGGSPRRAEDLLLETVQPPVAQMDSVTGQANSYEKLGMIYESFGSNEAAISNYQTALERYRSFDDTDAVGRMTDKLSHLKRSR